MKDKYQTVQMKKQDKSETMQNFIKVNAQLKIYLVCWILHCQARGVNSLKVFIKINMNDYLLILFLIFKNKS